MKTATKKAGRPRISESDRRVVIRLPDELWTALDAWRGKQSPIPSEHDAIRVAVAAGLANPLTLDRQLK
nr:hypothetical protein [uncultured Rhodopila sp.]